MYVKENPLTFQQVSEMIAYDAATGVFTWLKAPNRRTRIGAEAGVVKTTRRNPKANAVPSSYRYIGLRGFQMPATRIAWLLVTGDWPKGNLLFKDGDTLNLRFDNLKEGDFPAIITVKEGRRQYKMTRNAQRHYGLQQRYGLSLETYNVMLAAQDGVCAICKGVETYVPQGHGTTKPLSVDHNHETGEVRGLLCSNCNYVIGHCKEDEKVLLAAVAYLRKYNGIAAPTLTLVPAEAPK